MEKLVRKLPLFRGKERLSRWLFKSRIKNQEPFWVHGKFGSDYFLPNISENIGFEIFINGIYEQDTSDYIIRSLPENGVFLDLGANIGAITIPVARKRKDLSMVCVEAAPWIYEFLLKNLERNQLPGVRTFNKALYYTDDEILNFYSPLEKFGKGSLSPVFTQEAIEISTMRVDTLIQNLGIQKVDLIKIDVEGFESEVFKGASGLLGRRDAPDIIFEYVDWAEREARGVVPGSSQQILLDHGYRIFYFNGKNQMEEVRGIINKGFFMLFATKRKP